jgi:hypothetical protein
MSVIEQHPTDSNIDFKVHVGWRFNSRNFLVAKKDLYFKVISQFCRVCVQFGSSNFESVSGRLDKNTGIEF